jgi:hypothetical protein
MSDLLELIVKGLVFFFGVVGIAGGISWALGLIPPPEFDDGEE